MEWGIGEIIALVGGFCIVHPCQWTVSPDGLLAMPPFYTLSEAATAAAAAAADSHKLLPLGPHA